MDSRQTSIYRDADGAMVVRHTAGPQTAVWITRDELAMKWRGPQVWLIAAGATAAVMALRFITFLIRRAGSPGSYYTWTSGFAVLMTTLTVFVGILVILVVFSLLDIRHGSRRVRRYASPGAELAVRYLSDGLELITETESTAYTYDRIKKIRIKEHTVTLSGDFGQRVLPRELFPAEAISFLERSEAAVHRTSRRP